MAATITFYQAFSEAIADGRIDLDDDDLKLALFTSTHTPNAATDTAFGSLTNEVTNGNGYTTGGESLTTISWAQSGGTATLDADPVQWTASGGSIQARYGVLYDDTAAGKDLILYVELDTSDVTATDGNTLTVTWNASGIFTLS
jgi:hypothetical protein